MNFRNPTQKEIVKVLKSHPLVKFNEKVSRAFVVGSFATGKQSETSDLDVLIEVVSRSNESPEEIEQRYRRKIQGYFMKNGINGVRDNLHPQWMGRRVDVYITYDASTESRPMTALI